ncbi:MAG: FAD-dependent oxidoreductase [Variovorax sp.]
MPANTTSISNALVVGAGIAGCSAAISLARLGVEVTLIEKEARWRFQSSGIFVYSNGLASMDRLGVLAEMVQAGFAIEDGRNIYLDQDGAPIVDVFYPQPKARSAIAIPPILGIKRAEMHRVLAARLAQLDVPIQLATTVGKLDVTASPEAAKVTLSDGTTRHFDLVLGADGIRSATRALLFGESAPRYTGLGVWRSVHPRPPDLVAKIMMMGVGKRLGIMPISEDRLYLFGTVAEPAAAWYPREQWPAIMRARFAEFGSPARKFLDTLSAESEVLYTGVSEVAAPLPWHVGRSLLIGDAAHASTPFMGQGGAMAVQDGVVLANLLEAGGNVEDVLRRFGELRYPVCKFVQDASRRIGDAGAQEDRQACLRRDLALRQQGQQQVDDFYRELACLSAAV